MLFPYSRLLQYSWTTHIFISQDFWDFWKWRWQKADFSAQFCRSHGKVNSSSIYKKRNTFEGIDFIGIHIQNLKGFTFEETNFINGSLQFSKDSIFQKSNVEGIQFWRDSILEGFDFERLQFGRDSILKGIVLKEFNFEGIQFWRELF